MSFVNVYFYSKGKLLKRESLDFIGWEEFDVTKYDKIKVRLATYDETLTSEEEEELENSNLINIDKVKGDSFCECV